MTRRPTRPRRGKRRRRPLGSARARAEQSWARHYAPADMGKTIRRFEDTVGPGTKVVLWVRRSTVGQGDSTVDQKAVLRRAVVDAGGVVVDEVVDTHSARVHLDMSGWVVGFNTARRLAKEHDAVLLAESVCRFIRPPHFQHMGRDRVSRDGVVMSGPGAVPDETTVDEFRRLVRGIVVATSHDPNDGPRVVRSKQTSRSPRNGRPRRRTFGSAIDQGRRRSKATRLALRLIAEGVPKPKAIHTAADKVGVHVRTVHRGLAAFEDGGREALIPQKRGRPPKGQSRESDE